MQKEYASGRSGGAARGGVRGGKSRFSSGDSNANAKVNKVKVTADFVNSDAGR